MTSENALRKHWLQVADESTQIKVVALLLRGNIRNTRKKKLPENLTLKDILTMKFRYYPMYHYTLKIW